MFRQSPTNKQPQIVNLVTFIKGIDKNRLGAIVVVLVILISVFY